MDRRLINYWIGVAAVLAAFGCAQPVTEPPLIDVGPTAALVVTTDFQTGSYAVVDAATRQVYGDLDVIHQDSVCRYDAVSGKPFILARLGSDAIDVVRPEEGWQIVEEYSVEAGSNPRDIAVVSADRAYVARYAQADLLVVHPTEGTVIDRVDLSQYADEDGIPEAAWIYHLEGKVYVLLQRLDRPGGFVPTEHSLMVVLDGATGTVEAAVELTGTNPVGKLRFSEALERFVVVESGSFGTLGDGGIEYFDPRDNSVGGIAISDAQLGGDIVDAVIASPEKGYAIVGIRDGNTPQTELVSFDPSAGQKLETILRAQSWSFNYIELAPSGEELWLADATLENPGVRIFDTQTDEELTDSPLDVGLPPYMICFVEVR